MGKVYSNRICSKCGFEGRVIESWGTNYCKPCYDAKPKRKGGNGGMTLDPNLVLDDHTDASTGIVLEPVAKGNKIFSTLFLQHYPGSKGIMGRSINYLVRLNGKIAGIIGANSPPLNYKKFRAYFNTEDEKAFVNNNVFRLVINEKNLGTQVLRLFRNTLQRDYTTKYGDTLLGIVTFVEPPRTGAMYKADNWTALGETQGKSPKKRDMERWENKEWGEGTKKLIFAKRF